MSKNFHFRVWDQDDLRQSHLRFSDGKVFGATYQTTGRCHSQHRFGVGLGKPRECNGLFSDQSWECCRSPGAKPLIWQDTASAPMLSRPDPWRRHYWRQRLTKRRNCLAVPRDEQWQVWRSQYPTQRFTSPQEIAELALFLCSERATNITGANFVIDGGLTALLPER